MSRVECLVAQGGVSSLVSDATPPAISQVATGDRYAMRCVVPASSGATIHSSRHDTYLYGTDGTDGEAEVWVEQTAIVDAGGQTSDVLTIGGMLDVTSPTPVSLFTVHITLADMVLNTAGGITGTSSFVVTPGTAFRYRVRYKKGSGSDGILQIWILNTGTGDYDLVLDISNHTKTANARVVRESCAPDANLSNTTGEKSVAIYDVRIGTEVGHVGAWVEPGPILGGGVSSGDDDANVVVKLRCAIDHKRYVESVFAGSITCQPQYRVVGDGSWTNIGSPLTVAPDAAGDYWTYASVSVPPRTSGAKYEARAVWSNTGGEIAATASSTFYTMPASGTAGAFTVAWGSCITNVGSAASVAVSSQLSNERPHLAMGAIQAGAPNLFLHLGDGIYSDFVSPMFLSAGSSGASDADANTAEKQDQMWRDQWFYSSYHADLLRSVPMVYIHDDHEYGPDNWTTEGNATVTISGNRTTEYVLAYVADSASSIPKWWSGFAVQGIPGGAGSYWYTHDCLFVMLDSRSQRTRTETRDESEVLTDLQTNLYGTQKDWVVDLLRRNTKPMVVLCLPSPVSFMQRQWEDADTIEGPDGSNFTVDSRAEIQEIVRAACSRNWQMCAILTGDRHVPYVAVDDWFPANCIGEWCGGPFNHYKRAESLLGENPDEGTLVYIAPDPAAWMQSYGTLAIDEADDEMVLTQRDAAGSSLYTDTFERATVTGLGDLRTDAPVSIGSVTKGNTGATGTTTIEGTHPYHPLASSIEVGIVNRHATGQTVASVVMGGQSATLVAAASISAEMRLEVWRFTAAQVALLTDGDYTITQSAASLASAIFVDILDGQLPVYAEGSFADPVIGSDATAPGNGIVLAFTSWRYSSVDPASATGTLLADEVTSSASAGGNGNVNIQARFGTGSTTIETDLTDVVITPLMLVGGMAAVVDDSSGSRGSSTARRLVAMGVL
jgi:hypothetical protein